MPKQSLATRPSLAMLSAPPEDPAEYKRAGDELWIGLTLRYQEIASARDVEFLGKPPANPGQHREYQLALRRFHEYILDQTAVWGWRMDMSSEIVRIKAQWEALNPEFLERYGKQQGIRSKFVRGERPFPFSEGIEQFADGAIVELKVLLHMQRGEFAKRRTRPRCYQIAEWIRLEIETRPADFPHLYPYIGQLLGYIQVYLPTRNPKAARTLETGAVRADTFFYQWFAAATSRNVRDVRNQISLRRRQASDPSSLK